MLCICFPLINLIIGKILLDQRNNKLFIDKISTSEELLSITFNSIADAVITTGTDFRILRLNKVAEELLGWTRVEAGGRKLEEVLEIIEES